MPGQTRTTIDPPGSSAASSLSRTRQRDFGSNQDRVTSLRRDPTLEPKRGEFAPAVTTGVATYDRTNVSGATPTWLDRLREAIRKFDEGLIQHGRPEDTWSDKLEDKDATQSYGIPMTGDGDSERSIATKASEDATFLAPTIDLVEFFDIMDTVVGGLPDETTFHAYKKTWAEAKGKYNQGDYREMIDKIKELEGMVREACGVATEGEEDAGPGEQPTSQTYLERANVELVDRRHVSGHLQEPEGNTWYYDYADGTRDVVHEWVDPKEGLREELVRTERWK